MKRGSAESLDMMAKSPESGRGHRSFLISPTEIPTAVQLLGCEWAWENSWFQHVCARRGVQSPGLKTPGSLSSINHSSDPICKIIYVWLSSAWQVFGIRVGSARPNSPKLCARWNWHACISVRLKPLLACFKHKQVVHYLPGSDTVRKMD